MTRRAPAVFCSLLSGRGYTHWSLGEDEKFLRNADFKLRKSAPSGETYPKDSLW